MNKTIDLLIITTSIFRIAEEQKKQILATEPEPLPEDSPLWEIPGVILTPHASGSSPTNDRRRMNIFCQNLTYYVEGKPLENLVDFHEEY